LREEGIIIHSFTKIPEQAIRDQDNDAMVRRAERRTTQKASRPLGTDRNLPLSPSNYYLMVLQVLELAKSFHH